MSTADSTLRNTGPPAGSRPPGALVRWVTDWGSAVVDSIATVGDLAMFSWRMLQWMFSRLPQRGTLLVNFYQIGVLSLPVVALTGTFIGMVLAVQSYYQFHQIGDCLLHFNTAKSIGSESLASIGTSNSNCLSCVGLVHDVDK